MAHYVAAKSAVNGLTKSLALEYGPMGSPSTRFPRASSTRRCCARPRSAASSATPRRQIDGDAGAPHRQPEDIAAACAFLISEEAGYITGQILGVNGGRNT